MTIWVLYHPYWLSCILFTFTGRNWNEEFQVLIEKSFNDTENELQRTMELRKLYEEFTAEATRIGNLLKISTLYVCHLLLIDNVITINDVRSSIGVLVYSATVIPYTIKSARQAAITNHHSSH